MWVILIKLFKLWFLQGIVARSMLGTSSVTAGSVARPVAMAAVPVLSPLDDFENQKHSHVAFADYVVSQSKMVLKKPSKQLVHTLLKYCTDWLVKHIMQQDKPQIGRMIAGKMINYDGHVCRVPDTKVK